MLTCRSPAVRPPPPPPQSPLPSSCSQRRPHRPRQVPGWIQRVHERGDAIPVHLRRGEHRRAYPPPQSPLGLFRPDRGHELPTAAAATGRSARTSGAAASARPAAPRSGRSRACALQTEPRRSPVPQGLRGLPARPCYRRPVCFSHPEPGLSSQFWTGYSPVCQRQRPGVRRQRLGECGRHPVSIPGAGVDIIWGQHCSSIPGGKSHRRAK